MKKILIVVDMQNDFITGALVNTEAQKIVERLADYIRDFDGDIFATRDSHLPDYMNTREGRRLPVPHCIKGTDGWELAPEIMNALKEHKDGRTVEFIDKETFGCIELGKKVADNGYDDITICGVCTDICVISNAMIIKAALPEAEIRVVRDLCAGVTPKSHENALQAMAACQIDIV